MVINTKTSEHRKEYNKRYWREYYKKNKDKISKSYKIWCSKNKDKKNEEMKEYQKKNKNKVNARRVARYNIPIEKNKKCELCNINRGTERHHEDYSKPLDVKILCISCHVKVHNKK